MRQICSMEVSAQPWRNGGGRTRQLLAEPDGDDWSVRISLADIDRDGPFSAFPGVERWFTVVEGAGVILGFDGTPRRLAPGDAPLRFDGALAPSCTLLDGPTRDLNLMLRRGHGAMLAVSPGQDWTGPFDRRGLYARVPGRWHDGSGHDLALAAHTLLRDLPPGPCRFTPDPHQAKAGVIGWWLGWSADRSTADSAPPAP